MSLEESKHFWQITNSPNGAALIKQIRDKYDRLKAAYDTLVIPEIHKGNITMDQGREIYKNARKIAFETNMRKLMAAGFTKHEAITFA